MVIDDIAQHIHNKSIATMGQTLFKQFLPDNIDFALLVLDTGGVEPDKYLTEIKKPTFQVFIRSTTYYQGKAKLDSIRTEFHGKSGTTLVPGGTFFYSIFALQEGSHLGRDEKQRDLFSINFICETRDS